MKDTTEYPFVTLLCYRCRITAVSFALLISGCAVGPDYVRPAHPDVKNYTTDTLPTRTVSSDSEMGASQQFMSDQNIPADWWKLFSSESLNSLVDESLRRNPDLEAAQASLHESMENAYAAEGSFFPFVDLNGGPTRQRISAESFGQRMPPGSVFTLYNASVNVSYALDVFGGVRRQVESAQAQADYQRFQLEGTYLSLTANIITATVQEVSLREQIMETQHLIDIERQQLGVLRDQLKAGVLTQASVLEQEATLVQTEATLPVLRKQMMQKHDQVTVLTGHFPSEERKTILALATFHLPENLPLSLPSVLVEQRPDIRAAEEQLHEASANIGVSTAHMLPQITLTGGYGTSASRFHDMFTFPAEIWNIGAGLTQPVFHGGQLLHEHRASVAAYDRAAAQYRSTVLLAFENVSDALHAVQFDAAALQEQVKAAQVAAKSMDVIKQQLQVGSITYLALLDAEKTYLQARLNLVQARANRLADTVALFQALGGGWWNRPPLPERATSGT